MSRLAGASSQYQLYTHRYRLKERATGFYPVSLGSIPSTGAIFFYMSRC